MAWNPCQKDTMITVKRREHPSRHLSVKHIPQQKILVERMNRTLLERVRCMMLNASLPKSFLGKVVATAAYVINICQSTAIGL